MIYTCLLCIPQIHSHFSISIPELKFHRCPFQYGETNINDISSSRLEYDNVRLVIRF